MRIKWNGGVEVYRIAARGVRLKGRVVGSKVSWGQIDKLLPPPTGKPFTLPNIVVDVADTTIALRTPYGPLGFALQGRGNLSGGFKGKLAASAPRLAPGRAGSSSCALMSRVAVVARRPHVVGPVGAKSFACPASRLALTEPRMEIDSTFSEAFGSFDGKGRLSMTSVVAGVNGLAAVNSNLTFKGSATDIVGGDRPQRAPGAAGADPRRPHQHRGPLPARRAARRADPGRRLWRVERRSWRRR